MWGFRTIPPVAMSQAVLPVLEAVPVSCYSWLFRTWSFENNIIVEIEQLEVDDELISEHSEDGTSKTEHFFIDQPPKVSKRNNHDITPVEHVFVDCAAQTEVTLSMIAADVQWTPTITEFFVSEQRSDEPETSRLERAIIAQQHDELPAAVGQVWETDNSASDGKVTVDGMNDEGELVTFEQRGEEAEEKNEEVNDEEAVQVSDQIQNIERIRGGDLPQR